MGDWRHISSYGQFRRYLKNHLFGNEKSQRSVTHDSLRYINILTYLLTYCVWDLSRYVTSHPAQLNLAISSCVGAMSASQKAMMLCGWGVMVRVLVVGKTA